VVASSHDISQVAFQAKITEEVLFSFYIQYVRHILWLPNISDENKGQKTFSHAPFEPEPNLNFRFSSGFGRIPRTELKGTSVLGSEKLPSELNFSITIHRSIAIYCQKGHAHGIDIQNEPIIMISRFKRTKPAIYKPYYATQPALARDSGIYTLIILLP
jgi:hypothetical protein